MSEEKAPYVVESDMNAPANHAPANVAPANHAPANVAPANHAPANVAPANHAPANHAPANHAENPAPPILPKVFRHCPHCNSTNTFGNYLSPKAPSEKQVNAGLTLTGIFPGPIYNTQVIIATDVCLECGTMYAALIDRKILLAGSVQVQFPQRRA